MASASERVDITGIPVWLRGGLGVALAGSEAIPDRPRKPLLGGLRASFQAGLLALSRGPRRLPMDGPARRDSQTPSAVAPAHDMLITVAGPHRICTDFPILPRDFRESTWKVDGMDCPFPS
jgi:hypothetical protein